MRSALSQCSLHVGYKSEHQSPWPTYTHLEVRCKMPWWTQLNTPKSLQYNSNMPNQSKLMETTILREVIWHTDRQTLYELALVCRMLREPCQRTLLKAMRMCGDDGRHRSTMMMRMLRNQMAPGRYNIGLETFIQHIRLDIKHWTRDMKVWNTLIILLPHLTGLRSMTLATWCCFTTRLLMNYHTSMKGMFPIGFQRLTIHTVGVSILTMWIQSIWPTFQSPSKVPYTTCHPGATKSWANQSMTNSGLAGLKTLSMFLWWCSSLLMSCGMKCHLSRQYRCGPQKLQKGYSVLNSGHHHRTSSSQTIFWSEWCQSRWPYLGTPG